MTFAFLTTPCLPSADFPPSRGLDFGKGDQGGGSDKAQS